jgi:hypothetical protein
VLLQPPAAATPAALVAVACSTEQLLHVVQISLAISLLQPLVQHCSVLHSSL